MDTLTTYSVPDQEMTSAYAAPYLTSAGLPPSQPPRPIRFLWIKRLLCKLLRHKCVLDVTLNSDASGNISPWRIRCVSCGEINPFRKK